MSANPPLGSVDRPSDCWDWLTRDDVTRFALWAFERAKADSKPPPDQPFASIEGDLWCDRETVAEALCELFEMKVKAHAHAHGLGLGPYAADAERCLLNENPVSTTVRSGPPGGPALAGPWGGVL